MTVTFTKKARTSHAGYKILFKYIGTNRSTINKLKKIYHAKSNHKQMGATILIADEIDSKIRYITRVKEGDFIMAKHQGNRKIIFKYLITYHHIEFQYNEVKIDREIEGEKKDFFCSKSSSVSTRVLQTPAQSSKAQKDGAPSPAPQPLLSASHALSSSKYWFSTEHSN